MSYFPKLENVETPLGPASEVWATSETHIGMRGVFTINRVLYDVRLDLHYRDGEWKQGSEDTYTSAFHALMMDRADWDWSRGRRPDTSRAAWTKARDVLVPWLTEFAVSEGAEMVKRAGCEDRQRKIESARQKIEKLRAEVEQAERDLAELEG